jgi:hypothetical protein
MHQHLHLHVVLKIPAHQLLYYYEGAVDTVAAEAIDGRIVHFPANVLRLRSTEQRGVRHV